MLQEQKRSLTRLDGKILLYFGAFLTPKWWICQYNIITIFFLYVCQVFGKCVGMHNIRGFHTMQNHVHGADDISQRFFLLAVESFLLKRGHIGGA